MYGELWGYRVLIEYEKKLVFVVRLLKSMLKCEHHFCFEAVAWYLHFVVVVWLFPWNIQFHQIYQHSGSFLQECG